MRLSIPGYMIHGTNTPGGIGIRSSSGCIRMHPEDIESLFYKVSLGDPVRIVHQPYKIGQHGNRTFIEAHEPLSGEYYETENHTGTLEATIAEEAKLPISLEEARRAAEHSHGYPTLIN